MTKFAIIAFAALSILATAIPANASKKWKEDAK